MLVNLLYTNQCCSTCTWYSYSSTTRVPFDGTCTWTRVVLEYWWYLNLVLRCYLRTILMVFVLVPGLQTTHTWSLSTLNWKITCIQKFKVMYSILEWKWLGLRFKVLTKHHFPFCFLIRALMQGIDEPRFKKVNLKLSMMYSCLKDSHNERTLSSRNKSKDNQCFILHFAVIFQYMYLVLGC